MPAKKPFKVGDWVKVSSRADKTLKDIWTARVGVTQVIGASKSGEIFALKLKDGTTQSFDISALTLAKPSEIPTVEAPESPFDKAGFITNLKKGDKVRLVKSQGYGDHNEHEGEVGTVDYDYIGGNDITVRWSDDVASTFFFNDTKVPLTDALGPVEVEVKIKEMEIDTLIDMANEVEPLGKHEILGQDKAHKQLDVAVAKNMPVLLVGDTGTGKTTIVKSLAEKHKREWIRFNLTGETTVDEFVGKYVLIDKETVWEDGILLQAMKTGKWLIVDEVNVALPEILFVLHSLLDDDRAVTVSNHSGEVVKPHKNFRFFGTMNPVDEYAGTKDLNKAFKSRFGMILNLDYPSTKIETKVVQGKAGVDYSLACQLVDVAQRIRKAKANSEVFYTCSTRDLLQWGSLIDDLGIMDAFEVAILNKANGDREQVARIYADVTGNYVSAKKAGYNLNLDFIVKENKKLDEKKKEFERHRLEIEEQIKEELLNKLLDGGKKKPTPTIEVAAVTDEQVKQDLAAVDISGVDF